MVFKNLSRKKRQYNSYCRWGSIYIKKNYFLTAFTVDCDPSLK